MDIAESPNLSYRRQLFINEYLQSGNGALAAKRAGYSRRRLAPTAARLLAEPQITARIAAQRQKAQEKLSAALPARLEAMAKNVAPRLSQLLRIDGNTVRFVKPDDLPVDTLATMQMTDEGNFIVPLGNRFDDGSHPVTLLVDTEGNTVGLEFADMAAFVKQLAADSV